jgi:hypothetical protein
MHPDDRRRPNVSVQDIRRDLREADEDRYRLTAAAGDWRHPRVGVYDLRRYLREADEDRFVLTMRVRSLVSLIKRGSVVVCAFVLASVGFAFWSGWGESSSQALAPPAATLFGEPDSVQPDSEEESLDGHLFPSPVTIDRAILTPVRPSSRPTLRRAVHTPRASSTLRQRVSEPRAVPVPARHVAPRPLHPGEFGRKPSAN